MVSQAALRCGCVRCPSYRELEVHPPGPGKGAFINLHFFRAPVLGSYFVLDKISEYATHTVLPLSTTRGSYVKNIGPIRNSGSRQGRRGMAAEEGAAGGQGWQEGRYGSPKRAERESEESRVGGQESNAGGGQ